MRRLGLLLLALLALPLAGCSTPCQDLGDTLCACPAPGTTGDTCRQQVANLLKETGVSSDEDAFCSLRLDTCAAPAGASFCEWITTECGKVSCGIANGDPADPLVCIPPAP